jgi:uncharacterized protein YbaR (Trm112 family)
MIRIVCPYCHAPLSLAELEQASFDGHSGLVCPECDHLLVTEDDSPEPSAPAEAEMLAHA